LEEGGGGGVGGDFRLDVLDALGHGFQVVVVWVLGVMWLIKIPVVLGLSAGWKRAHVKAG